MTLKNAIFTSSGAPRDFRHRDIDSTPSRPPESGRIWAALTRKGEPYGESQIITFHMRSLALAIAFLLATSSRVASQGTTPAAQHTAGVIARVSAERLPT